MGTKLPTLTSKGVLSNPKIIIQRLFENFIKISAFQSNLYRNSPVPLKELLHLYNDDLAVMTDKTEETLIYMYGHYFDNVNIEIEYEQLTNQVFNILITGSMTDKITNKLYYLNKDITYNKDGYIETN